MEEYKYVKVIKPSNKHVWYSDKVGKVFKIKNIPEEQLAMREECWKVLDYKYGNFEELFVSKSIIENSTKEEYDLQNGFILPKKWCVRDTSSEESNELYEYANKYGARPPYMIQKSASYYHFPKYNNCTTSSNIKKRLH